MAAPGPRGLALGTPSVPTCRRRAVAASARASGWARLRAFPSQLNRFGSRSAILRCEGRLGGRIDTSSATAIPRRAWQRIKPGRSRLERRILFRSSGKGRLGARLGGAGLGRAGSGRAWEGPGWRGGRGARRGLRGRQESPSGPGLRRASPLLPRPSRPVEPSSGRGSLPPAPASTSPGTRSGRRPARTDRTGRST